MSTCLSANTKAILLLTAPLTVGRGMERAPLLKPAEYNALARRLRVLGRQPADLLQRDAAELLLDCQETVGVERLRHLLGRGFLLTQAVERWSGRALWVVSRADPEYPSRLRTRLKEAAPPVLYGCGDPGRLNAGGLAVVGSRHVTDVLLRATEHVGKLAAQAEQSVVSGGARGVDEAAVRGACSEGGCAAVVLADRLERAAVAAENRLPLREGRMVLVSPYDPAAGFNVGHAMQRNKLVYALADAALVMNAEKGKGGTWAGAVEQLKRFRFGPVFVHVESKPNEGAAALLALGAAVWPDRMNPTALSETLRTSPTTPRPAQQSPSLFPTRPTPDAAGPAEEPAAKVDPAEALLEAVKSVVGPQLDEPRTPDEIAELLHVSKVQARDWLKKLEEEGLLQRLSRPLRFQRVVPAAG